MNSQSRRDAGNVDASAPWGDEVRTALAALLRRAGGDPDEQDLAQETARKVIEAFPTLRANTAAEVHAFVATTYANVKRDAARRATTSSKHVVPDVVDDLELSAPTSCQPLDCVLRAELGAKQALVLQVASEAMAALSVWQRSLVLARLQGGPTLRELGEPRGLTPQQVWRDQVAAMRAMYADLLRRLRAEHPEVYEYFFPWDTE